jgi:putative endopeptidase
VGGEGWSSFGNLLLTLEMYTPYNSREQYSVYIMPFSEWSLSGQKSYTKYNSSDVKLRSYNESAAEYVLGELGYRESEIQRMLKENYQVEQKLAAGCIDDSKVTDTAKEVDETLTLEDLEQMQGDYPLTQILEAQGLDGSDLFSVYQKDYLNTLAGVYTEENLEALRSFYLVHLVLETLPYLDQKSYGISEQRRAVTENVKEQKETETEEEKTNQAQQMAYRIENDLFPDLLDELYAARYCKAEDKAALMELTQEMVSFYRQMLQEEDWLSEETRQKAVEKLDAMTLRVLYPDVLKDYSGLNYDSNGTIVDAVNDIQEFSLAERKNDVNQPIRKSDWPISTRTANAGYVQEENSINICAGLMADGQVYNRDASEEFNLGRVGMVIGHEITHAFDTNGYQYDKDGLKNNWWSKEDEEAMRQRADKVNKYYHSFTPVAGETYSANVASEAIADMGGVKCVLGIAKEREGFDYEEFFRSYAGLWKTKDNYSAELLMSEDTHPLAFLRTNITVQQFDEFLETFDIQEGDGMYLSPEERITVW